MQYRQRYCNPKPEGVTVSLTVVGLVQGHLFWGDVRYVVLDEADTMFDKGFGPEVRAVLGPLRSKANPAQVVLVVATLSQARRF